MLLNTDRVRILSSTGLGWFARGVFAISLLHGAYFFGSARGVQIGTGQAGSARVDFGFARVVQFSSSEVGKSNLFSVFRVYYDSRI